MLPEMPSTEALGRSLVPASAIPFKLDRTLSDSATRSLAYRSQSLIAAQSGDLGMWLFRP